MRRSRPASTFCTTVVVPCFNEAKRLEADRFAEFLDQQCEFAFLFVDDGSTDATREVLHGLCTRFPHRCSVLSLEANRGKAEAVRRGMMQAYASGADAVGYFDADLATPLESLPCMTDALQRRPDIQLVMGTRMRLQGHQIDRKRTRRLLGRSFALVASWTLGLAVVDTQCGAKLFRATPQIETLFSQPFRSRWIFDVEILARLSQHCGAQQAARQLYELPLESWREVPGSKLKSSDFLKAIGELAGNFWQYRLRPRSSQPAVPADPTAGTEPAAATVVHPAAQQRREDRAA